MLDSFMPKGQVAIAYIPGWNFNIVEEGPEALLASTGGVGRIELFPVADSEGSSKFSKGKLDLRFQVHESVVTLRASAGAPLPDAGDIAKLNPKVEKKPKKAVTVEAAGVTSTPAADAAKVKDSVAKPSGSVNAVITTPAAAATVTEPKDSTPHAEGEAHHHGGEGQTITPWEVEAEGGIDYEKLIRVRGSRPPITSTT